MRTYPTTGFLAVALSTAWLLCAGCQPESWSLGDPEVMRISAYELTTSPEQGTAEHKVERSGCTAAQTSCVYPLPATVSLPAGEAQTVTLVDIRANGVSATGGCILLRRSKCFVGRRPF